MEEDNLILKNWLQQKNIFVDNLITSRKRPTKDSVHDLRVAVKKLRSYLRLNETFTKEEWRGSFSEVKDLFKSFGRLRDFDMSLDLARRSERKWQMSLTAFKQYLTINRTLTRRWAKQAAIDFNEQQPVYDFQFSFFSDIPVTETSEKIINLSIAKIKKVKRLQKHFHKNAHEIRKQLKDVLYWLKICPKEFVESSIDIKLLDVSLKFLGSWQDDFIFKRKIKQYAKSMASKPEKETLAELEKKITINQKELLVKAEGKLNGLEIKKTLQ